jgi:hypothetical protein
MRRISDVVHPEGFPYIKLLPILEGQKAEVNYLPTSAPAFRSIEAAHHGHIRREWQSPGAAGIQVLPEKVPRFEGNDWPVEEGKDAKL